MKRKSYKQKYEDLLLEHHTKKYIHIPFSFGGIRRFFLFLGSLLLSVLNFMLLVSTWNLLELGDLSIDTVTNFSQLLIIYPLLGEYILIGLTLICFVAFIKGGFDKLKSYNEDSLLSGLLGGLIVGLQVGLLGGLLGGLLVGLLGGLLGGLLLGLLVGLFVGLLGEFEK